MLAHSSRGHSPSHQESMVARGSVRLLFNCNYSLDIESEQEVVIKAIKPQAPTSSDPPPTSRLRLLKVPNITNS